MNQHSLKLFSPTTLNWSSDETTCSEAADSVKYTLNMHTLVHKNDFSGCEHHTGADIAYVQLHSHYNNGTPLCIKKKEVKTKSSFSQALRFGGCNDTVHSYKRKDETCQIKRTYHPKHGHLYSI